MGKFLIPIITYLLFILEGSVMQVVTPQHFGNDTFLIPRFAVVFIILIAIYVSTARAIVLGLVFGLFYDLIYTDLIGIHMYAIALTAYISSVLSRLYHGNIVVVLILAMLGVTVFEFLVFGLNSLIGIIDSPIDLFLSRRLLPTLLLNAVFLIIIYYPFQKWLPLLEEEVQEK